MTQADRFRETLRAVLADMANDRGFGSSMQGLMLRPMLPAIIPMVAGIPDHVCDTVVTIIGDRLAWIRTGEAS